MNPRHRVRAALLAAAVSVAVVGALYACGTSPTRATALAGAAVVSSPPPAAPVPLPAARTSKVFGAGARPLARIPADNPRKGLVYRGLTAPRTGPCVGGFQLGGKGRARCTHGPDEPPVNVSVKTPAEPVTAKAAAAAATTGLTVCEGDGTTGRRVEVLYVHGATSQYDKYLDTFRLRAEQVDDIYYQSAVATGGVRHVRYVTEMVNGVCRAVVRDVQIADSALGDFDTARDAVVKAGYNRNDRKYLMFVDTNVYCGIGEFLGDTTKSDANRSNGGGYARVDNGCWQYPDVAAHELGHNLGAVNDDAPNASHHAHCTDEYDVMCYQDADDTVLHYACPDRSLDLRLDCNHDDYYNTNPSPGTYLAKEYNVADNLFLIKGASPAPGTSATPSAGATPSTSPSVSPSPSSGPASSPTASASPSPSPSPSTGTDTAALVVGKQSGRCVDTSGGSVADLTQTVLSDCTGTVTQKWTGTAGHELRLAGGKCLDAYGQSTVRGTKVIVFGCNGQDDQKWTLNADGTVVGVQSGLCLDAAGQGTANGTMLLLWTCNGQANQQWSRR